MQYLNVNSARMRLRRCGLPEDPGLHASALTALQTRARSQSDEQHDEVEFVIQPKGCSLNDKNNGNSTGSLDVGLWPSGAG
jgi:hypothetical protein